MRTPYQDRSLVRRIALALCLAATSASLASAAARAQTTAPAPDPAFEASRRAFEALSDAERRAVQDGLIWTGDYKGIVDGEFGRGTRAAIIAYAQRTGLPADGALDQSGRAMLAAAAAQARNGIGFAPLRDPKTGAMVGLPAKLLPRRADTAQGSRWSSSDGRIVFETSLQAPSAGDLPALFDRLKASTPQRKVTYRLLRPDFLVISGETGRSIFYTRITSPPPERPGPLRGYTLTYPAGVKGLDILSIAIANSWVAFPAPTAPAAATSGKAPALATSTPSPRPAGPVLSATALAVAPDQVVTVIGHCGEPRVAGRPASILRRDDATGLTIFRVVGLNAQVAALPAGGASVAEPVIAVFLQRKGAGNEAEPAVAPGEVLPAAPGAGQRVLVPLQPEGQGAPVFGRSGLLAGFAGRPQAIRRVAGILPQQAWPLVPLAALAALMDATPPMPSLSSAAAGGDHAAADLATAVRQSLFPVLCAP